MSKKIYSMCNLTLTNNHVTSPPIIRPTLLPFAPIGISPPWIAFVSKTWIDCRSAWPAWSSPAPRSPCCACSASSWRQSVSLGSRCRSVRFCGTVSPRSAAGARTCSVQARCSAAWSRSPCSGRRSRWTASAETKLAWCRTLPAVCRSHSSATVTETASDETRRGQDPHTPTSSPPAIYNSFADWNYWLSYTIELNYCVDIL